MRILLAVVILGGCDPGGRNTPSDGPAGLDAATDAPPATDTSRVYAHSSTMLYRLNSLTLGAVEIGPLNLPGTQGLLDLAIDKDDRLVGITRDNLFTIHAASGAATQLANLSPTADGFTSLSFVPATFSDPASPDILVTVNDQGDVFRLDNGTPVKIGSYGTDAALGKIVSSGDLIAVRGFGIFATVDVGSRTEDFLARIDPVTWKATPIGSGTGFDKIFGLGYWNGRIYGFVDDGFQAATGRIIDLDPITGEGLLISSGDIRWFGAGVATDAPIL